MTPADWGVLIGSAIAALGLTPAAVHHVRRYRARGRHQDTHQDAGSKPPEFWQLETRRAIEESVRPHIELLIKQLGAVQDVLRHDILDSRTQLHELRDIVAPSVATIPLVVDKLQSLNTKLDNVLATLPRGGRR